jgi:HAD superfamily hydrolase (TIGR01549 family)
MEIKNLTQLPLSFKTKAVIFDCFGTLMDIKLKQQPYKFLMKYFYSQGYKDSDFAVWLMTHNVSLEDIEKKVGIKIDQQAKIDFQNLLQKELNSISAYPEVNKLLGDLKRANIKTMLCSNLATPYGNPARNKTVGLDYYIMSYEIGFIKPQYQIFELCQENLGFEKDEIIFVGDTEKDDFLGSKNFGFNSYWLRRDK